MGLLSRLKNKSASQTRFQLITDRGNGYYQWDGKIYQSDIVRSCIRPKVKAIGKLVAKHVRTSIGPDGQKKIEVNPEPYLRFLLEEPNPYMSGQKLQEKLATQLCLNNNAFALIIRDANGFATEIYPITALSVEAIYDNNATLYLKFVLQNGKSCIYPYADIIHLRNDYNDNDIFGSSLSQALKPLMDIISTTDQGIVKAIKNSGTVQWLLKLTRSVRPEDVADAAKQFADTYLSVESESFGVAAVDSKADAIRVEPKDYVPNALQMDRTTQRILSLFNTNQKIIQGDYTEDEWTAYYESEIEPVALDLKNEFTRKIFSRKQRGYGNAIIFEASNLQCASINTKLNLLQMVDRGALLPNEWRATFNLAPVPGGDKPVRRLDTAPVQENVD